MPSKAPTLRSWQKGGLAGVGGFVLLALAGELQDHVSFYYLETAWYQTLAWLNYPAGELSRVILNKLEVPRLTDTPLTWREAVIINLTAWTFGVVWWFLLGTAVSLVWRRLKRLTGR